MTRQPYQAKRSRVPAFVALAGELAGTGTAMAPCTATWSSFRNDHGIGWPMGTGGDPSG